MYTIERNEGRLIEARIASPLTAADVDGIVQSVRMNVISQPGKVICVADLTRLDGLPPDAVDAFVAMFTRDNPKVERSAFMLARSTSTMALQMNRMIRAAKSTSRMAYDDVPTLRSWLDEVLRPPERASLKRFLSQVELGEPPSSKKLMPTLDALVEPPSSRSSRRPPPSR